MKINIKARFTELLRGWKLLRRNIIYIDGEITHESAQVVIKHLHRLAPKQKTIFLVIKSRGGKLEAAQGIVETIKGLSVPVTGIAIGQEIASAASYIFEACHTRVIEVNTLLILHLIWADLEFVIRLTPETKAAEIMPVVEKHIEGHKTEMRTQQRAVYKLYAERANAPSTQIKRLFLSDTAIDAKQALAVKLADKVIYRFDFKNPENVFK